jgi:hypothetical protein
MKQVYEEAAFIAYYFHWDMKDILQMEHRDRLRWCEEISAVHQKSSGKEERNIFEV